MLPLLSDNDLINSFLIYAVLFGYLTVWSVARYVFCFNFKNLSVGKFDTAVLSACTTSALRFLVCSVGLNGAKEKMLWVTTDGIIAVMENLHAIRESTVEQSIGNSMCSRRFTTTGSNSVPIFISAVEPGPANISVTGLNLCPKVNWCMGFGHFNTPPVLIIPQAKGSKV